MLNGDLGIARSLKHGRKSIHWLTSVAAGRDREHPLWSVWGDWHSGALGQLLWDLENWPGKQCGFPGQS